MLRGGRITQRGLIYGDVYLLFFFFSLYCVSSLQFCCKNFSIRLTSFIWFVCCLTFYFSLFVFYLIAIYFLWLHWILYSFRPLFYLYAYLPISTGPIHILYATGDSWIAFPQLSWTLMAYVSCPMSKLIKNWSRKVSYLFIQPLSKGWPAGCSVNRNWCCVAC